MPISFLRSAAFFRRAVSTETDTIMSQQTLFFFAPMKVGRGKAASGGGSGGGGWIWGPAHTKGGATGTRPLVV